ncbi:MAG: hypothetical protein KKE05_02845 [Nanoarchaeota archaeon]|nr:hypothetical protein [Nanoarchaeota archaeon]
MKKLLTDLDYVRLYAEKMRRDNSLFEQQKVLIESQLQSSRSLFQNTFGIGAEFKKNAREYLRKVGLIKPPAR